MRVVWRPTPAGLAQHLAAGRRAAPTYPEVGATARSTLPPGYAVIDEARVVGSGWPAWERLGAALLGWDLHREARMLLAVSSPRVESGSTVVTAAPFGPVALLAPCRVVALLDRPGQRGFSYGTLPGHVLTGEEQLSAEIGPDAVVRLRIRSFSRPVGLAGVSPRAARTGQQLVNRRYVAAARRVAA